MTAPRWLLAFVVVLAAVAGVVAYPYFEAWTRPGGPIILLPEGEPLPKFSSPMIVQGIDRPAVLAGAAAGLPDEEPVIGIEAAGKARAYRVAAFSSMFAHVVNDVVGGKPVTVTHCNKNDCTQVYTGGKPDRPLPIALAGWHDQMMLRDPAGFFWQHAGTPVDPQQPAEKRYDFFPFARTTWKLWREVHPDSDVYVSPP